MTLKNLLPFVVLVACASGQKPADNPAPGTAATPTAGAALIDGTGAAMAGIAAGTPEQIVAAPDRTEKDRSIDAKRKPVETLTFLQLKPGLRVAEIGAGGGYTTELIARSVGPQGKVFAQNPPSWIKSWLTKSWPARLERSQCANIVRIDREWDDPLPPEARELDSVVNVATYHDVIAEHHDTGAMNRAIFAALKSGGTYSIIDNTAKDKSGAAEVDRLHRIDEQFLRAEVEKAGFRFAGEDGFLRNPADDRTWNADPGADKRTGTQDRFAIRFVKP